MRRRIFEVIEVSTAGDKASRVYDWFMMVTILCSLVPLATKSTAPWTVAIDWLQSAFSLYAAADKAKQRKQLV